MATIGPPLSTTAWAAEFTAQTLEILPVFMRDGAIFWLKPVHADSLRIGLAPKSSPGDEVIAAMKWYPLTPHVVHSTSWRHDEGRVTLHLRGGGRAAGSAAAGFAHDASRRSS